MYARTDSDLERYQHFWKTWCDLSAEGCCDEVGGAEWTRVLAEWEKQGRPDPSPFIKVWANLPAIRTPASLRAPSPAISTTPFNDPDELSKKGEGSTDMNLFWHVFVQRLFEERLHIGSLLRWLEAFETRLAEENVSGERRKSMRPYFDKAGDFCHSLMAELMELQRSRRRPLKKPPATNHGQEE